MNRLFDALLALASAGCVLLAYFLWKEHSEMTGPALVPLLSALIMLVCALAELIKGGRKAAYSPRALFTLVITLAFCLALYLGAPFLIAAPVYLFALIVFLRRGRYVSGAAISLIAVALIYLLFEVLLGIDLP